MAYTDKQKLIETNVNYTSKDFSTIKADLIEYTKAYFPDTYKDFNETSPGMMLIELSSYVGDVLSYYIDYNYKENLLATATEKRNVRRLSEFLGYKVPNKTPSVVRLKVTTTIDANSDGTPNYGQAPSSIDSGLQIASNVDSQILFETTSEIDFTSSGSGDPAISAPILNSDGEASSYTLTRYVRAVSGQTKTKTFTISSPTKFLELDLGEDNVIEITSCIDGAGQEWYEVDYLGQDLIIEERNIESRGTGGFFSSTVMQSGSLSPAKLAIFRKKPRRFATRINSDMKLELWFGSGTNDTSDELLTLNSTQIANSKYNQAKAKFI